MEGFPVNSHKLGAWPVVPLAHVDATLVTAAPAAVAASDLVTFADAFAIENHHECMSIMSFHDQIDTVAAVATPASEDFEIAVDSNPAVVVADAEPAALGVLGAVVSGACIPIRIIVDSVVLP